MQSVQFPSPGDVVHLDFRPGTSLSTQKCPKRPLRLMQWNVERGYQLDKVIQQLQQADADIISLQEVDVGCERSDNKDTGALIAQALQFNYLFICEFEELPSELRDARSQGGGVHGNAILTKFDFNGWNVIEHTHHPIDWNLDPKQQTHPLAAKEPRRGRRLTLAANIATPQGPLRVYCCHLEVFCGITSRVWQFSDILVDAKQHMIQPVEACASQPQRSSVDQQTEELHEVQQKFGQCQLLGQHHSSSGSGGSYSCKTGHNPTMYRCQAILGDLNTMGHGVARLSPNYCCDAMRWRSIGSSEAAWWQKHVLAVMEPCRVNKYLLQAGLPPHVAQAAVNPGFFDPFDVDKGITLDNPSYRIGPFHMMAGKLDWCLLHGMRVHHKTVGNHDYAASDHKWIKVEVELLQ